jgi:hypothetical protein
MSHYYSGGKAYKTYIGHAVQRMLVRPIKENFFLFDPFFVIVFLTVKLFTCNQSFQLILNRWKKLTNYCSNTVIAQSLI